MTEEITLSEEQQAASDGLVKFLEDFPNTRRPYYVIEGYAGTGKSFTINKIIEQLKLKARYMAYTGKAALVLQKYSGVDAATIHSTIYKLLTVSDEVFEDLYNKMDNADSDAEAHEIQLQIDELKQPKFDLDPDAFEESRPDILVLDECSMVDEEMLADLCTYGIPIVALGDPEQLPPVKGTGALFAGVADARLTEIRRQALESPIISWSMQVREKRTLAMTDLDTVLEDEAARIPVGFVKSDMLWDLFQDHDIFLCWKNKTRQAFNMWVRKRLGHFQDSPVYPVPGDRLIITKNDKKLGIFNGLFCEVLEVGEILDVSIQVKVKTELDQELDLNLLRACFDMYFNPDAMKALKPWEFRGTQQADYGYAITTHKAQGSQWPRVLVRDENVFDWHKGDAQDRRAEWLYTAITRAAEKVTIISGRNSA